VLRAPGRNKTLAVTGGSSRQELRPIFLRPIPEGLESYMETPSINDICEAQGGNLIKLKSKRNLPQKPVSFDIPDEGKNVSSIRIIKKNETSGGVNLMDIRTPSPGVLQSVLTSTASLTPKVTRLSRSNSSFIGIGNTPDLTKMGFGKMPALTS
jgi:hypothetical protein